MPALGCLSSVHFIWALLFSLSIGTAQERETSFKKLIIGTKEAPPFSMKATDGSWTGISMDLWRDISTELNLSYELRAMELRELIEGVKNGSLDAAVAALTITPEREIDLDFTHAFHTSGLGIAVAFEGNNPWKAILGGFFSVAFLKIVLVLSLLLLAVGVLVWWFERKRNPGQFGGKGVKGIGAGFWWSAVTMTTVGYGDKAPATLGGRLVALIWMFGGIIIISSFTAAIASVLTVSQLESWIQGPEDLPRVRVGTIPDSTSEAYLRTNRIAFRPCASVRAGLSALSKGEIDAVVYDAPMLRYLSSNEFQGVVQVIPNTFSRQDYAFALPSESPLRESVNQVLLQKISEPSWQETLYRFLGR